MADAALGFYPWLRRGLGVGISRPDTDAADVNPAAKVVVDVQMFRRPVEQDGETVRLRLPLVGLTLSLIFAARVSMILIT